eukprot:jgi/Chlat1/9079/Chrsp96S08371
MRRNSAVTDMTRPPHRAAAGLPVVCAASPCSIRFSSCLCYLLLCAVMWLLCGAAASEEETPLRFVPLVLAPYEKDWPPTISSGLDALPQVASGETTALRPAMLSFRAGWLPRDDTIPTDGSRGAILPLASRKVDGSVEIIVEATSVDIPVDELSFIARAVGPETVLADISNTTVVGHSVGSDIPYQSRYSLVFPPAITAGTYQLDIFLTYASSQDAFIKPPLCSKGCICSVLVSEATHKALKVDMPPLAPVSSPQQEAELPACDQLITPAGRWVARSDRTEGSEYRWVPWACRYQRQDWVYATAGECLTVPDIRSSSKGEGAISDSSPLPTLPQREMVLVGDSHTMRAALFFVRIRGFQWGPYRVRGNTACRYLDMKRTPAAGKKGKSGKKGGDCSKPVVYNRKVCVTLLTYIKEVLPGQLASLSARDVVVLGDTAHWDLRDVGLEEYKLGVRDIAAVLKQVLAEAAAGVNNNTNNNSTRGIPLVVWRTAPAFSYRNALLGPREYRTNERLREAASYSSAVMSALGLPVWDSFAITETWFERSCDAHHYLCADADSELHWVGRADVGQLLSLIC